MVRICGRILRPGANLAARRLGHSRVRRQNEGMVSMTGYLVRRAGQMALTLFLIVTLAFFLV